MTLLFIISILVTATLSGYGGYRLGSFYISKENMTLRNQLQLQEQFSKNWAAEATDKYTLSQKVSWQQAQNLGSIMSAMAQTLTLYQNQNANKIDKNENQKVSEIISKAKSIASLHDS